MESVLTLHELMIGIQVILILVFLFTLGLLLYSFREYKLVASRNRWKEILDDYLMKAIVAGPEEALEINPILQDLCQDRGFRRFFLGQLIASERRFSGAALNTLKEIFYTYQLDKEAYVLMRNRKPYLIARGIQALTIMQDKQALKEIKDKIQHPDPNVALEVQYAMVYFEGFQGLGFLSDLKSPISDWQQLRILNSIKSLPSDADQQLLKWLGCDQVTVVILALKMIRKFQLFEMEDILFQKLGNSDPKIQEEVIKTLFSIEQETTSTRLLAYFPSGSTLEQFAIIKGLGQTRALDKLDFLKTQLLEYPDPQGKVLIAEAMASMGEIPFLMQLRGQLLPEDQTRSILNHALKSTI